MAEDYSKNYLVPKKGKRYVYYHRLETDFGGIYKKWYDAVSNFLKDEVIGGFDLQENADFVSQLADAEEKKERLAINRMFQGEINVDPSNMSTQQLVRCINMLVGGTEVFERNLALLLEMGENDEIIDPKTGKVISKGGQKAMPAWFATYLEKAWNDYADKMVDDITILLNNYSLEEAIRLGVEKNIPSVIDLAIKKASEAGVESGIKKGREKYINAYKNVFSELQKLKNAGNDYIDQFIDIFQLQEFTRELAKEISNNTSSLNLSPSDFLITKKFTSNDTKYGRGKWSAAGNVKELFATMIQNLLSGMKINQKSGNVELDGEIASSEGERMGQYGTRIDMVFSYGITGLKHSISQLGIDASKLGNVKNAVKFMENLKKYRNSLIVFVSSKDYTLNAGFRRRGGYEATTLTPKTLEGTLKAAKINRPTLIASIMQLCQGAVGSNKNKEDNGYKKNIENEIAQYFAYIFFDDVKTIGEELVKSNNGIAIHLMYLNGIYIPLSVFLRQLAKAIYMQANQNRGIKATVKVTIDAPEILYPEKNMPNKIKDWNEQAADALNNIRINIQFLSNMRTFINNIFNDKF